MRTLLLPLLVLTLPLAACKRPDTVPVPEPEVAAASTASPASAETASGADDNLNAVLWVQTSTEYEALTTQTYRAAADHLEKALAEANWDALVPDERANAADGLPPAVILDIDETVLDNSPYQARLVHNGKEYDEVTWAEWVAEKRAEPGPGVVDFA